MGGRPSQRAKAQGGKEQLRFGQIARRLGFITDDMLDEALLRQKRRVDEGKAHMLIGLVLLELGHLDNAQLIEILRAYEKGS